MVPNEIRKVTAEEPNEQEASNMPQKSQSSYHKQHTALEKGG